MTDIIKLVIIKWCGRLGNNIIQIVNCLSIALHYQCNVQIPTHKYFNKTDLNLFGVNLVGGNQSRIKVITDYFFNMDNIKDIKIDKKWVKIYFKQIQQVLQSIFIIKPPSVLNDNTLLIHIRSGDIFGKHPHPGYIPAPLSYYTKIIDSNKYNEIYIISEDDRNPCIPKLKSMYKNVKFDIHHLDFDIKLVLSAPNIVISTGTFISALLIFSKNIKHIYRPSELGLSMCDLILSNVKQTTISLKLYYQLIGKWQNSENQVKQILDFKLE